MVGSLALDAQPCCQESTKEETSHHIPSILKLFVLVTEKMKKQARDL